MKSTEALHWLEVIRNEMEAQMLAECRAAPANGGNASVIAQSYDAKLTALAVAMDQLCRGLKVHCISPPEEIVREIRQFMPF